MRTMLSDMSTYRVIPKHPTSSLQRKMNGLLLQLKKDVSLPPQGYNRLRCSSGSIPSIYVLPKIHKSGVPVSFYTSPTYHLSKHLVGILSPLVGNTSYTVRNPRELVSFAQSICLRNECLVLFTRMPVDLALQIARLRLENDVSLGCQLTIPFLYYCYVSKPLIFPFAGLYTNKCMALLWDIQFRLWLPT